MSPRLQIVSSGESNQSIGCVVLAGQPNAGKTSLFNRLTGLRAQTANFPGTTVEVKQGQLSLSIGQAMLLDLPGLYGLDGTSPEQEAARRVLRGEDQKFPKPDAIVVVLDATRLPQHLPFAGELREQNIPVVIALNMIDEAVRRGVEIKFEELARELGAPIVAISARRGTGISELVGTIEQLLVETGTVAGTPPELSACSSCGSCVMTARCRWADDVSERVSTNRNSADSLRSYRIDKALTSTRFGLPFFSLVMVALFASVFLIAARPMDWIDAVFGAIADWTAAHAPVETLGSFLADGVIAGVGGVLVFVPQIFILFFAISLLEDSGYLARAVVAIDRVMRRFGLPGQAFVPMLSAHACAIPAIMATRVIENRKDRLRTILVIPLLTCSARLPVYLMIAVLLFGSNPIGGFLVFFTGYLLGAIAAVAVSLLLRHSVVTGTPARLAIELPPYRWPSLRVALFNAADRSWMFIRNAGTIVLAISVILWALASFPSLSPDDVKRYAQGEDKKILMTAQAEQATGKAFAPEWEEEQKRIQTKYELEYSIAGRLGRLVEPVFEPLGFDWRISIGVLSSFAAREVIVSVLSVIAGLGEDAEPGSGLIGSLKKMKRTDGTPLFDIATSLSLFVFFVLAMQCLPTQVVTRKETGSWKWAFFQLGYMTILAYSAAFITYQSARVIVG